MQVMKVTNMSCLTPEGAMSGDCDFLSANLYARSLFGMHDLFRFCFLLLKTYLIRSGEDALANLSVEKTTAGTIAGHVRIRSKTQGIALSLGDKITMGERSNCPSAYFSLGLHSVLIFSQITNLNCNGGHETLAHTS
jgi:coatomer subunit beta